MKKARAYIPHLVPGSSLQIVADIPGFPMSVNKCEGFGSENVELGKGNIRGREHAA